MLEKENSLGNTTVSTTSNSQLAWALFEPRYRNDIEAVFKYKLASIRGLLTGKDTVLEPKAFERFGGYFPLNEEELFLKEKLRQREPEFFRSRGIV